MRMTKSAELKMQFFYRDMHIFFFFVDKMMCSQLHTDVHTGSYAPDCPHSWQASGSYHTDIVIYM